MQQQQAWAAGLGGLAVAGVGEEGGGGGPAPTTVDEASMERSKSFVKALQVGLPAGRGPGSGRDPAAPRGSFFFSFSEMNCSS
jgi:hypothetical protein